MKANLPHLHPYLPQIVIFMLEQHGELHHAHTDKIAIYRWSASC